MFEFKHKGDPVEELQEGAEKSLDKNEAHAKKRISICKGCSAIYFAVVFALWYIDAETLTTFTVVFFGYALWWIGEKWELELKVKRLTVERDLWKVKYWQHRSGEVRK